MFSPDSNQQASAANVEISFRGTSLILSRQDAFTMLNLQKPWEWAIFYQIGLFDVQDTCIRTGFQGKTHQITLKEYDEISAALQESYLTIDW